MAKTTSSKMQERLQRLMAEYKVPRGRRAEPRPSRSATSPITPPAAQKISRPRAPNAPSPRPVLAQDTSKSSGRLPRELIWDTFKGVRVLVSSIPNYAAERTPQGNYSVFQLSPRIVVARRLRLMDVMPAIRKHHERIIELAVHEADQKRQTEADIKADFEAFENQPGFYIVPGETIGPDNKTYNAAGPYWRFETLNPDLRPPETEAYNITDDDVEDAAWHTSHALIKQNDSTPVTIIEARNPHEASQGKGHVLWINGAFKGPLVNPKRGFEW